MLATYALRVIITMHKQKCARTTFCKYLSTPDMKSRVFIFKVNTLMNCTRIKKCTTCTPHGLFQ